MSLSPEVVDALLSLLRKTAAQTIEEAALINQCWIEIQENQEVPSEP